MTVTQERPTEAADSFAALSAAVHPAWHQAILRLASATERVAATMALWMGSNNMDGAFVRSTRDLATALIDFLDELEADPDLEPSLGSGQNGGDDREAEDEHSEPSLGWTDKEAMRGQYSGVSDGELDRADDEPSLGSPVMIGMSELRSQEHWAGSGRDDREEDSDFEEDSWPAPAA